MLYIHPVDDKVVGGPSTFMRNLHAFLNTVHYPIQNEIYHSTGIFFPIQFDQQVLKYYQKIGGAIIQRLDGIYYPSQHGEQYKRLNSSIKSVYDDYATHVVFQSNYSRKQCFEMLGPKNQASYSIIPNGVDKTIFYPNPVRKLGEEGKIRLITVGNFRKKAMIVPIIKSLDKLSEMYPLELVAVGNVLDPTLEEYLKRDYVLRIGPKNAQGVAQLLRTSDIFLHSQLNDNCPNAVIEAIATGLPVVGFSSGAMPELCSFSLNLLAGIPHKLFHTYEDFKWELLVEKIEFCVRNYDQSRKSAMKNIGLYNFEECGIQYIEVFDKQLARSKSINPPWKYLMKGSARQIFRKVKRQIPRNFYHLRSSS